MNISSGISEIGFPSGAYSTQKVWLWPVYNAGVVDPLFRISRENESRTVYTNIPPSDREKVIEDTKRDAGEIYSIEGPRSKALCPPAGNLFDAYV